jgi:hypothetical protein
VVLEKHREETVEANGIEKRRSITNSQGGEKYPTSNKKHG